MHETVRVQILQRVDNQGQHLAHFFRRKGAIGQDERQVLFRIFRYEIDHVRATDLRLP